MKTTKLLILLAVFGLHYSIASGQCDLITVNGSTQMPDGVCAPVTFGMEAHYQFLVPVDPSLVQILYRWNDAANTETLVSGNWNAAGDSVWAVATHVYPPDDECSKVAEAILAYDGELCESSGYQSQVFATWGTDEENSGQLQIEPVVHYVCEGVDVIDFTFDDNSTFNCNINIEPDRPNRIQRWTQFSYNTYAMGSDRIPSVTVRDDGGTVHSMTDGGGNFIANLDGPIVAIPYPADGPTETSYAITAPAGGVAGDIFEITLRNWNICNPYDETPNDGLPPADPINGDNPPIVTTARIEIIAPTPVVVPSLFEFCTGDNLVLSASAGSAEIRWYNNADLDTLLHIGANFDVTQAPASIDNDVPGTYRFYVTTFQGICESAPTPVDLVVYQSPEPANAGLDKTVCYDTITLAANTPAVGTGTWTTTSTANINSINNATTRVTDLEFGENHFTWTIRNGICNTSDEVIIFSDRQPSPAYAGPDQLLCDQSNTAMAATLPDMQGNGQWNIISGAGSFSDADLHNSNYSGFVNDTNTLMWRVASRYDVCPVTHDTVKVVSDLTAGNANAGIDVYLCEEAVQALSGNAPVNEGSGIWALVSGSGTIADPSDNITSISGFGFGQTSLSWSLIPKLGICPVTTDTITINNDQYPGDADAGPDADYCLQTQHNLAANTPLVGSSLWSVLENPSGFAPTFSPNNTTNNALFSVNPGNEGAYMLEWQFVNGACVSRDTIVIDFGIPVPQAETGNDTVACGYDFEMHGNTIAIGQGTWSVLAGPGAVSYSPDEHSANTIASFQPGNEGIYTFEWRFTSGSCPPTMDTVDIEITLAPLPPVLSDLQSCGPDSFAINVPAALPRYKAYWYNTPTGGTEFYSGNTYETGVLNSTERYYVKLRDTVSTCESPRVQLEITIDEIPAQPLLVGDTLCEPGTGTVLATPLAPANAVLWYNTDQSVITDTTNVLVIDTLSVSQLFRARAINLATNCISPVDSVSVVVHEEIPAPVVYSDSSCGSSDFVLQADKSDPANLLFWYNAENALINIGDSLQTPTLDSATNYFVAEYNPITRCLGDQSEVNVRINEIPELPVISDTSSCGAASFVLQPGTNNAQNTFKWYSHPIDNNLLAIADSFQTPLLTTNEVYWLSAYNPATGCEGDRAQVEATIYPSPAAIDILGPTLVLKDQTDVVFFTINGQPGSTYLWDIPADIIEEQNMNDFVRLAFPNLGNFTISTQELTVNGCLGPPVYHNITVVEDSIAIDLGDYEQGGCTAEPFEIKPWLFGGTPPYIYQWTGDTEYLSSTNTLFTTFSPPGVGTYTLYLEVADVNLKRSKDSILIEVFESPTTQITNTDTVACVGDIYPITTQSTGATPVSHLWSGPIHRLNNYLIAEPSYSPYSIDTVTYYYRMTDINGCHAFDSITIVSDEPKADFNVLTEPGCSPLLVDFENTSEHAVSYNWDFGGMGNSTAVNPDFEFVNTSPEIKYVEVNLEAISPLGCSDNAQQYVMVWPNPSADLSAIPQNSCNPAHAMLVSNPGNRYYHWSFGDGSADTTTGSFSLYHTYVNTSTTDKTFTATVITESPLNCMDTASIDLTVYATPDVDFIVSPLEQMIPDNSFALDNNTEGDWDYEWNFGDGRTDNNGLLESVEYEEPGWYYISLKASGEHCSDSATEQVHLMPAPPVAAFKGADNGCMPHTITLVNGSLNASSYLWDFGDGSVSTAKDPTYTYYQPGIYKIRLKVSGPGGEAVYSDTSRVYILPNSFFDLAPRYVYVNDEPVHYFNLSDNADIIEWDFGDGETSTELNPKHIYKEEGTFDVTLKVWTENGCFDLYVMENAVLVEPSGLVEFPNVFRPNSNIVENRVFKPGIIDHVDDYHLMIFNRWGELLFESFDQDEGWDGYYDGKIAKQDVYVWKVIGTYSDGKGFSKTGDVTLLY